MKKYLPLFIIGIGLYVLYRSSNKSIKVDTSQTGDKYNPNMNGARRRTPISNHQAI